MDEMNVYRQNRVDFYDLILEFEFTIDDSLQFIQNWRDIINLKKDGDYSPYLELNDLDFLLKMTKGDGDIANQYLQELILAGGTISDDSWHQFQISRFKPA